MRRLLAVILAVTIWFSIAPVAFAADQQTSPLVPCSQSPAFQKRAAAARQTTDDPNSGKNRFERYSQAMCGPEGLPHLIVDGSLNHAGEFLIPSILFLYITGWIGWVGRMYLIWAAKSGNQEDKEIIINVPKAVSFMLAGFTWPLLALKELGTGELLAKDDEITVSPR